MAKVGEDPVWLQGGMPELFSKVVDWRNEKGGVSFRVVS